MSTNDVIMTKSLETHVQMIINPNSLDNKSSWRILKDLYCSVTMLRELGLMNVPSLKLIGLIKLPKVALRMKTSLILWGKSWKKKQKGKQICITKTSCSPKIGNS